MWFFKSAEYLKFLWQHFGHVPVIGKNIYICTIAYVIVLYLIFNLNDIQSKKNEFGRENMNITHSFIYWINSKFSIPVPNC